MLVWLQFHTISLKFFVYIVNNKKDEIEANRSSDNKSDKINGEQFTFQCGACGLMFQKLDDFFEHKPVHDRAKNFTCVVCKKTYIAIYDLKNHIKIHSDPEFYCADCSKQFHYK